MERDGYSVQTAIDGEQALNTARSVRPDLIILDVMLPQLDGFEVCRILRRESDVPILMLTARGEEIDRVVGLELGADDYVTKPFSVRELMARVRNMLRRSTRASATNGESADVDILRAGDLEIDSTSHIVRRGGVRLELKPREFDLLALLAKNRTRAFTRDQIPRTSLGARLLWRQSHGGCPCPLAAREDRARTRQARPYRHDSRRRIPL